MKILYLTGTGDLVGGAEVSLYNLLRGLDRNRFQPMVVMPFTGDYTKKIADLAIPVEIIPFKKVKNPLNIPSSVKTVQQLVRLIKDTTVELVHANTQTGSVAFLGSLAARSSKIPFIWHPRIAFSGRIWDAIQFPLCTKVIVISEAAKKRFFWLPGKEKLVRIYNAVALDEFDTYTDMLSFREEMGVKEGELLVATVGRSHPVKKFEYLIKAAAFVVKEAPYAKFLLIGFDSADHDRYLRYLKELAGRLHLEDKVIFVEKRFDISRVLHAVDIFVFTSMIDAFGRVLIEAMACEKPVVAFNSGAAPEIVNDGKSGFLVPARDYKTMASRITYLLKNKEIRDAYGKAGRKRVEELFAVGDHIRQMQTLYTEVTKSR